MIISFRSVLAGMVVLGTALAVTPATSKADVDIYLSVPPACPWGYYDSPPYHCAPYGYWGAEFFYNGIFIGVGPWWGWGYDHGWGRNRFHGYYRPGRAYRYYYDDRDGRYDRYDRQERDYRDDHRHEDERRFRDDRRYRDAHGDRSERRDHGDRDDRGDRGRHRPDGR